MSDPKPPKPTPPPIRLVRESGKISMAETWTGGANISSPDPEPTFKSLNTPRSNTVSEETDGLSTGGLIGIGVAILCVLCGAGLGLASFIGGIYGFLKMVGLV